MKHQLILFIFILLSIQVKAQKNIYITSFTSFDRIVTQLIKPSYPDNNSITVKPLEINFEVKNRFLVGMSIKTLAYDVPKKVIINAIRNSKNISLEHQNLNRRLSYKNNVFLPQINIRYLVTSYNKVSLFTGLSYGIYYNNKNNPFVYNNTKSIKINGESRTEKISAIIKDKNFNQAIDIEAGLYFFDIKNSQFFMKVNSYFTIFKSSNLNLNYKHQADVNQNVNTEENHTIKIPIQKMASLSFSIGYRLEYKKQKNETN